MRQRTRRDAAREAQKLQKRRNLLVGVRDRQAVALSVKEFEKRLQALFEQLERMKIVQFDEFPALGKHQQSEIGNHVFQEDPKQILKNAKVHELTANREREKEKRKKLRNRLQLIANHVEQRIERFVLLRHLQTIRTNRKKKKRETTGLFKLSRMNAIKSSTRELNGRETIHCACLLICFNALRLVSAGDTHTHTTALHECFVDRIGRLLAERMLVVVLRMSDADADDDVRPEVQRDDRSTFRSCSASHTFVL
jgi:hypothetical protein